ncbi:appendage [Achromobacter phage vB_AxyP_19-32_Axy24]|uniref:Putative tail fiber protein n=1 Tax=Achromobacter phage vB_AxyP_19-32_Axy24 TaxID=2591048 RepID=A0A514CW89_9CAUD|nr:appendage [Achromobacter phage vB_AxyP_19-32_Axy24]QDH84722.1 putative tail fiber protein [Achromobacter phage vB_AxyP_19-32_Axy24]
MNSQNPFPSGDSCCGTNYDMTVDQLLGNAYQVVKFVAMRMPFIKTVSDNIDKVIAIVAALDKLKELEAKLPELLALHEKLAELMKLYTHLNELLLISSNMTQLLTVHDNLPQINAIYDNLSKVQTVAADITKIVTVADNINAVKNLDTNMAAILNVNNNLTVVKNVSDNMVDVRNVSSNMVQVKDVSAYMAEILAVYAKLGDLELLATQLDEVLTKFTDLADSGGSAMVGFIQNGTGTVTRTSQEKMRETISAADFGATGEGDAYDVELQNALNAAAGKKLEIGPGMYKLVTTDALLVPSNTTVILHPQAVIHQTQKGKKAAIAALPGSHDISICGGKLIGPYYQGFPQWVGRQNTVLDNGDNWNDHLAHNIGIDLRGRMYQREVLGYSLAQMQALTDEMHSITIFNTEIYGFGQSAIIADNITGFYADKLHLHDCGRDGLRMYGVRDGYITRPLVHDLLLGKDGAYPNWNVYGISCTRVYGKTGYPDPDLRIGRPTERVSVENFNIYNCFNWKSLDTHGGRRLRFINGTIRNSYIGIGVDSGGSGDAGVAPPIDVTIGGVQFISDSGAKYKRAGIAAFASGTNNDGRIGLGNGLNIFGCTFDGYGGDNFDAALSISNFRNVNVGTTHFKNFSRAAIFMSQICEDINIGAGVSMDGPKNYMTIVPSNGGSGYTSAPDVIVTGGDGTKLEAIAYITNGSVSSVDIIYMSNDWTVAPTISFSGGGGSGAAANATIFPGRGVIVGSATCSGTMTGVTMRNSDPAMSGAWGVEFVSAPAPNYGFKVSNDVGFYGHFSERVRNFRYEGGGTFQRVPIAQVRCTPAGVPTGGYGVASVSKSGTGEYVVTLSNSQATSPNQINPEATIYNTPNTLVRARADSATQITVQTTNLSSNFEDASFMLTVWANQGVLGQ